MSNVPQDVTNDELRQLWKEAGGEFHGPNIETGTMPESKLLPFLRQLRAQRQQGSEPVYQRQYIVGNWKDVDEEEYNIMAYAYPRRIVYATPPQSNALVAAAYRKAAELIMPKEGGYVSPKLRHLTDAADEVSKLNAEIILNAIPADAEAALRDYTADKIRKALDIMVEQMDCGKEVFSDDDEQAIVNSVLGEGGK
jgi:hypothetical protein